MSSFLSAQARNVAELAASVSGYPIVVRSEPTLDVWSKARYPRPGESICLITYHPAHAKFLDYLIAHESGHICRFFSARPEDRMVPAADPSALQKARRQVAGECWRLKHAIPKDMLSQFVGTRGSQLVQQLTNFPVDCRIEDWIYQNFESLRDVQVSALRELYSTSLRCLEPKIRDWAPPSIYKRSNSMNYAMAKRIAKLVNEPGLVAPYLEKGLGEIGEKLDSYLAGEDLGHAGDLKAVDAWASELAIKQWYRWLRV